MTTHVRYSIYYIYI